MNDEKKTVSPELSDEDLDQVAGGYGGPNNPCPVCGSTSRAKMEKNDYVCPDCGHVYFHRPSHVGLF